MPTMPSMEPSPHPEASESTNKERPRAFARHHFILVSVLAVAIAFFACLAYLTVSLPDVDYLRDENPDATSLMKQRWAEARREGRKPRRIQMWIPLDDVS